MKTEKDDSGTFYAVPGLTTIYCLSSNVRLTPV